MLEAGFSAHLLDQVPITTLIGTGDRARIWPVRLPQGTREQITPAITFQRVAGIPEYHSRGLAGLVMVRLQVDCWASSYQVAKALADAVRVAVDGFRGAMDAEVVQGVFLRGDRDLYESAVDVHRVNMDFEIWVEE